MASAVRRILAENVHRKAAEKHGGLAQRVDLDEDAVPAEYRPSDVLTLDQAVRTLPKHHERQSLHVRLYHAPIFAVLGRAPCDE